MHRHILGLVVLAAVLVNQGGLVARRAQTAPPASDHVAWVATVFARMQTIKVGMTRADLAKVFETEGGIFQRQSRTFVSRDCPYFKVDVEFKPVGPSRVSEEGFSLFENDQDIITTISTPYLQFPRAD